MACRLPSLTLRCALLEATFRNLFSLFLVGSKSNVSAVFWLRFPLVGHYTSFFLVGSKSDVSAFFWLRFRNGFGTKPAGVLLFRMRVPNTFFLSLAWWLAGFFFVFSRFQKQRFGSFLAAVSHRHFSLFGIFRRFQKQRFGSFLAAVSHGLGPTFVCPCSCGVIRPLINSYPEVMKGSL